MPRHGRLNKAFIQRLRRLVRRRDPVSGRRRNTHIGDAERSDILTLSRAGYTIARIATTLDRSETTIARVVHEAAQTLRDQLEAPLMVSYQRAAEVAAEKGDHRPALEMLDRMGSIPETSRQRTALAVAQMTSDAQRALVTNGANARGGNGPTVNIGIGLPHQLGAGDSGILFSTVQSPGPVEKRVQKVDGAMLPIIDHS